MCKREGTGVKFMIIDVKIDTQGCTLGQDVVNQSLRFDLGKLEQCGGNGTCPGYVVQTQLLKK